MLGSIIPSSRYLIRQVLGRVDWRGVRVVVEYGPGVGGFTREILARLPPEGRLVAIDLNGEFVRYLRGVVRDPRLRLVEGSAADVRAILAGQGLDTADLILSGIPFTTLPEAVRQQVLESSREALRPGGSLLIYQFSATVLPYLRRAFPRVEQGFEVRNVLPARIFCAIRPASASPGVGLGLSSPGGLDKAGARFSPPPSPRG